MHYLIRSTSAKRLFILELPALILALVVAELLYKFGSFTLECVAFLITCYVFSLMSDFISKQTGIASKLQ